MNDDIELVLGNSNPRFSGVTSTMLQVLPHQQQLARLAVLGKHHLPDSAQSLSYSNFISLCRRPMSNGNKRVFHARRNDEMIQALLAKKLFDADIKIAFTSTAQREHSRFSRWLMQQMDAIITTSQTAARYLHHRQPDIIIPHGIDISTYQPASSRRAAWQATGLPGDYGIGIFGRVRHSKGVDVLVDATLPLLPEFPGATVVICGECISKDQSYQDAMKKSIAATGLSERYVFLGKRPFSEIPGLFQSMSVVVALSRSEGFGLTPLEAMASGTAVVTSEAGAWKDIVQNGVQGYCVPTGDVSAVRDKLRIMLTDLEATHAMGLAGRLYVEQNYTVEKEAARLTEFLLALGKS